MAVHDMCADIAALLNPIPTPVDGAATESDEESYAHAAEEAWREREEMAEGLRMSWAEEDVDPLLSTLTYLRNRRLQLEADMRLLIAYGRCFTHPRPYKLIDLANAAGMSISASAPPTTLTRSTRPPRSSSARHPRLRSQPVTGNGLGLGAASASSRPQLAPLRCEGSLRHHRNPWPSRHDHQAGPRADHPLSPAKALGHRRVQRRLLRRTQARPGQGSRLGLARAR